MGAMAGCDTASNAPRVAQSLAASYMVAALADGTRAAYARSLKKLKTFVDKTLPGEVWFPTSPDIVVLFVVALLDGGNAPSTVALGVICNCVCSQIAWFM